MKLFPFSLRLKTRFWRGIWTLTQLNESKLITFEITQRVTWLFEQKKQVKGWKNNQKWMKVHIVSILNAGDVSLKGKIEKKSVGNVSFKN